MGNSERKDVRGSAFGTDIQVHVDEIILYPTPSPPHTQVDIESFFILVKHTRTYSVYMCYVITVVSRASAHVYTSFQGINVAASIQKYGNYVPGMHPCGPKLRCMFKHPWALTRDTMVHVCTDHVKSTLACRN